MLVAPLLEGVEGDFGFVPVFVGVESLCLSELPDIAPLGMAALGRRGFWPV